MLGRLAMQAAARQSRLDGTATLCDQGADEARKHISGTSAGQCSITSHILVGQHAICASNQCPVAL